MGSARRGLTWHAVDISGVVNLDDVAGGGATLGLGDNTSGDKHHFIVSGHGWGEPIAGGLLMQVLDDVDGEKVEHAHVITL